MKIPPLEVTAADGSLHSFTLSGIFQGFPFHVFPSFQDILICLSDSTSMQSFNKTISTDNAIDHFRSKSVPDSVIMVPVKDKI